MGSAQSYIPVTVVVAGAAAYGYTQLNKPAAAAQHPSATSSASSSKKKQKKKAGAGAASEKEDVSAVPSVVSFPPVVPGDFDAPTPTPASPPPEPAGPSAAAKSKKKKKGKKASPVPADAQSESSATAPESSAVRKPKKPSAPKPALDDDGWTKVETKKRTTKDGAKADAASAGAPGQLEISTSDAGVTTSATGNSSPVTERTEDESVLADSALSEHRRPLAERLLPKPRKTGVEDLLEEPDYPQLSRVMRIKPRPDEQPAAGFSWGDYEDVDSRGTADDADGEDDGGWGVVKSRGRSKPNKSAPQQTPTPQKAPETLTKKQRQHAAKREAEKAAKAAAEAERLATLAKHKRELERTRIAEQAKSSSKNVSGGMSAYVDENGKLVWS